MALQTDGTAMVYRTITGASLSSWSITMWIYSTIGTYAGGKLVARGEGNTTSANALRLDRGGSDAQTVLWNGSGTAYGASYDVAVNTWYFYGWTKNGNTHLVYRGTEGGAIGSALSFGESGGSNPTTNILALMGAMAYGTNPDDVLTSGSRICAVKYWDNTVLTSGEVESERLKYSAQKAGVYAEYKMNYGTSAGCLADSSGNGRDLTATTGTLSTGTGPSGVEDGGGGGGTPGTITSTITL